MKRLFVGAFCALSLASCDLLTGDNKCRDAEDVLWSGTDEYCQDKSAYCLHCDCWNQTRLFIPGDRACSVAPVKVGTTTAQCTGETAAVADNCLKDQAACKQSGVTTAATLCEASKKTP